MKNVVFFEHKSMGGISQHIRHPTHDWEPNDDSSDETVEDDLRAPAPAPTLAAKTLAVAPGPGKTRYESHVNHEPQWWGPRVGLGWGSAACRSVFSPFFPAPAPQIIGIGTASYKKPG